MEFILGSQIQALTDALETGVFLTILTCSLPAWVCVCCGGGGVILKWGLICFGPTEGYTFSHTCCSDLCSKCPLLP
jgi:hypothetical protein